MTYTLQITIDCISVHSQADWWAETLGWVVEPTDQAFIDDVLAKGWAQPDELVEHNGVRVWRDGSAICRPGEEGQKGRLRILFQPVPEPKTVKNRCHLDINLNGGSKDDTRARLEARGAQFLYEANQGPHIWSTMADPEGNEFCIS
ncbi:VOC family protein [Arthrobacter sp. CAN_A1]|uniref:VOC family protein n=1 Tax=Arthrobacter sp. CAN_A1 TaxID=2787717 RepID=UPI0018CA93A4